MFGVVWASAFLALSFVGSIVVCVSLVGMPISVEFEAALIFLAALLAVVGMMGLVSLPRLVLPPN